MNNLKKVGLSALAGSLVAFSANAVEVTVSGKTEVTTQVKLIVLTETNGVVETLLHSLVQEI